MKRRSLLAGVTTGMAGFAGCVDPDSPTRSVTIFNRTPDPIEVSICIVSTNDDDVVVSGTETVDPDGSETFGPFPKRDVVEGTQLYIQLNNEEREPIEVDFSIGYVDLAIDDDGNIDVNYAEI